MSSGGCGGDVIRGVFAGPTVWGWSLSGIGRSAVLDPETRSGPSCPVSFSLLFLINNYFSILC